ncbi:helicase-related protein [Streptomyces thermocarboxydus]
MGSSGAAHGAPAVIARAHHGSVSKEQRAQVEEDLKAGRLPAVVATSSLELGIDMGAVDLVVQVESPPSVASGLQRVGRAGHQVGAVSTGVVFPKYRGDLVQAAVVTERMRTGEIEALRVPSNPLDVLAQQIVAMTAMDTWQFDDLLAVVRRAAPFASLPESAFTSVLDMLAGRYPSDAFAELRPAWCGTGSRARSPAAREPSAWPSPRAARSRTAVCSACSWRAPTPRRAGAGSASWTRRWSTSRAWATSSRSAPAPGVSRTSRATGSWSPRAGHAGPAAVLEGRPAGPPWSWAARWARSCARWARCPTRTPGCGCWPRAWTPGPRTTCCRT